MTITPVRGQDGAIRHFVAIKQDVTDRRKLEDQLRQAQKMEAIGTLAGGIAHDFNNILGAMFGFGYLLREDLAGNDTAREYVEEILRSANRAKELVQQILTFSRQHEQKPQVIKLDLVVREAIKFLRASLPANIVIELDLDSAAYAVLADPTQIYQVTMNLATNALHAMEGRPGRLTITLEGVVPDGKFLAAHPELKPIPYVRLTMADNGQGMDAKTRERIFEPFFTTKPVGQGTGLGLAVVHGIVKSHGGIITVESEVGQGTTFRLYFPAQPAGVVAGETGSRPPARGHGERILVVDDEPALTAVYQRLLDRLGFQTVVTNYPEEALRMIRKSPANFGLVITDMTMPGINGLDLARQIRGLRPDLRVILTSGFSPALNDEALRAAGVHELVMKPVTLDDLAAVVQRALKG
jgi:nitrogen-specific signal transduction histidine kinase